MLSWLAVGVTSFLLVELGPREAPRHFEREFLLERHHVLILSKGSFVAADCPLVGVWD